MRIKRYNPDQPKDGEDIFYIQSHGLNAGRPLKKPIPNSWELETKTANAFEICFAVFTSNILRVYLRGSVIPFLSLRDYKKIISPFLSSDRIHDENLRLKLTTIEKIDCEIINLEARKRLYKQLRTTLANEVTKTLSK